MLRTTHLNAPEVVTTLMSGGIGVIRTDTLYGVVASARDEHAVARVYALKRRDPSKAVIVLIGSVSQLFDQVPERARPVIETVWPGPVSVILPTEHGPEWVHRGSQTIAYRLPADDNLRRLLQETGPLIAPSANPESLPPATTVEEAIAYFGDMVDVYVDGGSTDGTAASQLFSIDESGEVTRLR